MPYPNASAPDSVRRILAIIYYGRRKLAAAWRRADTAVDGGREMRSGQPGIQHRQPFPQMIDAVHSGGCDTTNAIGYDSTRRVK